MNPTRNPSHRKGDKNTMPTGQPNGGRLWGGKASAFGPNSKLQCPRTFWFRAADAQSWDNPINEGYLSKQSGIMKSWKRKWVRLTKTDLFIFDSPTVGRSCD